MLRTCYELLGTLGALPVFAGLQAEGSQAIAYLSPLGLAAVLCLACAEARRRCSRCWYWGSGGQCGVGAAMPPV